MYETLADDRLGFLYCGELLDEHTARLIEISEEAVRMFDGPSSLAKRLAFVLVEAYQNIIRHRAPDFGTSPCRNMLLMRSDGHAYQVSSINPIRDEETARLKDLLDQIQRNKDLKQLKEMFLRGLQGGSISERGGAGLGLIEMARRSADGLEHWITGQPGDHAFALQLSVGGKARPRSLSEMLSLQDLAVRSNAELIHKGPLPPGMRMALMRMIGHGDGKEKESVIGAYLAAIELLTEHASPPDDPMLVFGKEGGNHVIVIAMVCGHGAAEALKDQLKALAEMDRNAAQKAYRDALLGRPGRISTSMLDMARRSRTPIGMAMFPHDDRAFIVLECRV